MRILVIEPKPTVAKQIAALVEGHELVDMTERAMTQTDVKKLGENVIVSCGKFSDDVDDAFSLVFCKRKDENKAAECGTPVVISMTEKSQEKDKRTIQKAIEEYEEEPSLYEEEEEEEEYYSYYSGCESEEDNEDSDKK